MDDFNFDLAETQPQALIQQPVEDVIVIIGTPLPSGLFGPYTVTWNNFEDAGDFFGDFDSTAGLEPFDPSPDDGIPGLNIEITQNPDGTYNITWTAERTGYFDLNESGVRDSSDNPELDEPIVNAGDTDTYTNLTWEELQGVQSGLETFSRPDVGV